MSFRGSVSPKPAILLAAVVLLVSASAASAQTQASSTPLAPAMLSPQAAYDQASAPIEITRRSRNNWSDIERNAVDVAVGQAGGACKERSTVHYVGGDLIAYARLCDLGQQWKAVETAAASYIDSNDAEKPLLDQAYGFAVVANLNLKLWKPAAGYCFAMMKSVPYGPMTDDVTTMAIHDMQFAFLPDALDLLFQRQHLLLQQIRAAQSTSQAASPAAAKIPLHTLYEHALELAAMQQYNNQPERAAEVIAELDRALPPNPAPDEAILIAAAQRRYALLGTHFPELPGAVPLLAAGAQDHATFGAVTVFLLFPPWCAQCVRQEREMAPALYRNAEHGVHMYGLLADKPPMASKSASQQVSESAGAVRRGVTPKGAAAHAAPDAVVDGLKPAAEELRGTPTLVVAPATLAQFEAADFPFLIAVDHAGMIRLIVPGAPDNALVADGPVDQIIDTIEQNWPASKPASGGESKAPGAASNVPSNAKPEAQPAK